MTVRFKACPRCHGDVFIDKDIFQGWVERCIQCGHVSYLDAVVETQECLVSGGVKE